MQSLFKMWVHSCERTKAKVFKLEGTDLPESGVWSIEGRGGRSAVFWVWWKGKEIYCGQTYFEAINMWENKLNERRASEGDDNKISR